MTGQIRGRSDDSPNLVDIHVGNRLRLRRNVLRITQQQLASYVGLTFQQIQKYENGANRIGASRLWDIACVLGVNIDFFFEDMDDKTKNASPRKLLGVEENGGGSPFSRQNPAPDPMRTETALQLVRAYNRIPNRKLADVLYNLMISLSHTSSYLNDKSDDETEF